MTRAHEAQLAPLIEALLQTQRLLLWNHLLQPIPICSDLMTTARCVQGRLDSTEALLHCLSIIQCPARFPEILAVPGNKVKVFIFRTFKLNYHEIHFTLLPL